MFGRRRTSGLRLFFATDIHGSEQCFRKLLNAAAFYDVHHLIVGGDITGKALVPILRDRHGLYECRFDGRVFSDLDESGRQGLEAAIRRLGLYPVVGTYEQLRELDDEQIREKVFERIVYDSVCTWVSLAEERIGGTGRRLFVGLGNDDYPIIEGAFRGSETVVLAEGRHLFLDDIHEMITVGYSNPTPWHTPRELPEEELGRRYRALAKFVSDPSNCLAVLHPPPFDSQLDLAPELDDALRVRMERGQGVRMQPVGSVAVRSFIQEFQPLLGLHGHVHESRGTTQVGRTLCLNPGSEYTEGVLTGAILEIGNGQVISYQLVTG